MKFFKNSQLKKQYAVSYTAINNWIRRAKEGKLELQLYDEANKSYIANTAKNLLTIEKLVVQGKKYKNSLAHKTVTPRAEFYKLYSRKQIFDIITNLDIHHEIPGQYNYFDEGAIYWDKYAQRLWKEETANTLSGTVELLHSNIGNLDRLLEGCDRVNVVDLGIGNCLPVKELLTHLLYERGVLDRYIAVDISPKMLEIGRDNIHKWFDGRVKFESHVRDVAYERFDDLLIDETLRSDADSSANLVLLLGATLANFRSPNNVLNAIYNSVGRNDIFIYTTKLDTATSRQYFDFNAEARVDTLSLNDRFIFDLLNVDSSFYDVEMGFDEAIRQRYIRVKLKIALSIEFDFPEGVRYVDLNKNDTILLWRFWHQTTRDIIDQFEGLGFSLLQASTTQDREYLLVASAINTKPA